MEDTTKFREGLARTARYSLWLDVTAAVFFVLAAIGLVVLVFLQSILAEIPLTYGLVGAVLFQIPAIILFLTFLVLLILAHHRRYGRSGLFSISHGQAPLACEKLATIS